MKLTILKSFPWHRDAYAQGKDYEVPDAVARQFIAARLAKPADKTESAAAAGAQVAKPVKAAQARRPAPAQKSAEPGSHAVTAMMQPTKEDEDSKAKAAAEAKSPGATAPYHRRDMTAEK